MFKKINGCVSENTLRKLYYAPVSTRKRYYVPNDYLQLMNLKATKKW
ncbi:L-dopachrome tautomerase-related protein [Spiroplasma poulsonii]